MEDQRGSAVPPKRRLLGGHLLLITAALTCPCHLPILLAILGGTTLAAFVEQHITLVAIGLTGYFLLALIWGLKLIGQRKETQASRERDLSKGMESLGCCPRPLTLACAPDLGQAQAPAMNREAVSLDVISHEIAHGS